MATEYVYQISGESIGDVEILLDNHIIDATVSCHGTGPCTQDKVNALLAAKISPICTGGNDYTSTCGNAANAQCYEVLANMGFQAAGGESTDRDEMIAAQQFICYETFGGCYGSPNIDPFVMANFEHVTGGKGVVAYLESYCNSTLLEQQVINAICNAWDHYCEEAGVMIGTWMPKDATPYIEIANNVIASRGKFSGFSLWNGCGSSMSDTVNEWADVLATLQEQFPPTNVMLIDRLKGIEPTPTKPDLSGIYGILFE
jgi:hypothetical protein